MTTYSKKDFAAPDGPILLLSAKGLTTAGIAEANGVKDFSGNGHHGRAFGTGILVSEDNEMGACFDCQGTNDSYLLVQHGVLDNKREFTIHFKWKSSEPSSNDWVFVASGDGTINTRQICVAASTSYIRHWIHDNVNNIDTGDCFYDQNPFDDILHTFTYVVDFNNAIAILYVDGVKFTEGVVNVASTYKITSQHFTFGNAWTAFKNAPHKGKLADIRIYPRAFSAAEVKYLYNGFQPNIIVGQTIPSGAILDLSARGLTTAGIAQANGVVDRSGNGNHGQAYNGVAVVNDDEMGSCFSFSDSSETLYNISGSLADTSDSMTLSVLYKRTGIRSGYNQLLLSETRNTDTESNYYLRICLFIKTTQDADIVGVAMYNNGDSDPLLCDINTTLGKVTSDVHLYTATYNALTSIISLYVDGVLATTKTRTAQDFTVGYYRIGFNNKNYSPLGILTDVKIYPRALTASEIQQLADASLKKISDINLGSNTIKHIYYGGNLVYAKIDDYVLETVKENKTIALDSSNTDLWGVCKIRSTGDYVLACGNANIIKVYDGSTGSVKFTTSMVNTSALKYDVCPGKEADVIYLAEHTTNASNSKIRKLRYTGTGFTEITNTATGSWHGITYDHANNRIIGTNYYGSAIQAFSDDDDTTAMTQVLNISAPYRVANVKVTSDGRYIYYTGYSNNYLGRYDTVTGTRNNNFMLMVSSGSGWTITGFALSDDEKKVVFVNNPNQCIKILDLETGQITATVDDSDSYTIRISNIGDNVFLYIAWDRSTILPKYIIERDLSPYLT